MKPEPPNMRVNLTGALVAPIASASATMRFAGCATGRRSAAGAPAGSPRRLNRVSVWYVTG